MSQRSSGPTLAARASKSASLTLSPLARNSSQLLSRPRAPRYLDAFIALTMAATATRLLLS